MSDWGQSFGLAWSTSWGSGTSAAVLTGGGTSRRLLPDHRALAVLGEDRLALELVTIFLEFIDDEAILH